MSIHLKLIKKQYSFYNLLVGKKIIFAITGIILISFVLVHLLGNLTIFAGRDILNNYAHVLHENKILFIISNLIIITSLITHIWISIQLTLINRKAKSVKYINQQYLQPSLSARNMMITGTIIALFIIFHLYHFAGSNLYANEYNLIDDQGKKDIFLMIIQEFSYIPISIIYMFSITILGLHLNHAIFSFFQTIGLLKTEKIINTMKRTSKKISFFLFFGYIIIPITILLKIIK